MIPTQRIQQMLEYLDGKEVVSVEEVRTMLNISPATIRRDFKTMARERLVQRVRGGIKLIRPAAGEMIPVELREIRYPLEKQALARKAAELLSPGDAVIIDGGTTTSMLAGSIPDFPLRIITNSVRLVASFEAHRQNNPRLDIYVTGGILYPHSGLLLGPSAQAGMMQYHAQWAFLSVGGITDSATFNTNEFVVEVERAMVNSAEKVVVLADHSKIGKPALCSAIGLDEIDILITDEFPENDRTLQKIADVGVQVIKVPVPALDGHTATGRPRPQGKMTAEKTQSLSSGQVSVR